MTRPFDRLAPSFRIATVVGITAIISSTPRGSLRPFAAYLPLCLLLLLTAAVPKWLVVWRSFAAAPFILLSAGILALQGGITPQAITGMMPAALSVATKGFSAALLLSFLTTSTALAGLLSGLRRLGVPESLNLILALMYRYTALLGEEFTRMQRARDCRTVRPLGLRLAPVHGRQLGALLLRSWDRAERVHAAMLARGFTGSWPEGARVQTGWFDWLFTASACGAFLAARLLLTSPAA